MTTYRISQLAERVGIRPTTLRFYEQLGLLSARRSPAGYREYDDSAVERLRFVTAGKRLGLPLDEIRDLLTIRDDGLCVDVCDRLRPLLTEHIAAAERQSAELAASTELLRRALAEVDGSTRVGPCAPECLELADDPPIACTLGGDDLADRVAQWRTLLAEVTGRQPIPGGLRVTLPTGLAARAAELAAAEHACCLFFEFTLRFATGELHLDVRAPAAAASLVTELFG